MQTPETTCEDDEIPTFDESGAAPDPFEDDEVCKLFFFVLYMYTLYLKCTLCIPYTIGALCLDRRF